MANLSGLQVLIRYFRLEILDDSERIKQDIIEKANEFNAIKNLLEISQNDEARGYAIANKILKKGMEIVNNNDTIEGLQVLEDILYPKDPE